ncbi:hypothetical protein PSHT_01915 [Puccinia striiformis]|uniref:Uncharacterized protein n=1 Tax=Puccinia striiformis TaxID=27350 RepID=A0A2S4WJ52_9BASI|nr:hypothetical protein PSHT_01915 [Puccinia striiformis]
MNVRPRLASGHTPEQRLQVLVVSLPPSEAFSESQRRDKQVEKTRKPFWEIVRPPRHPSRTSAHPQLDGTIHGGTAHKSAPNGHQSLGRVNLRGTMYEDRDMIMRLYLIRSIVLRLSTLLQTENDQPACPGQAVKSSGNLTGPMWTLEHTSGKPSPAA